MARQKQIQIQVQRQKKQKQQKKYKAKEHGPFGAKDAQKIGEELENIRATKGKLTPELLVEKAKNENSVLNKFIDWDDTSASHKYRLEQARAIIRNVVEIVVIKGKATEEKAYFSVTVKNDDEREKQYVPITEVIKSKDYRTQLLTEMRDDLENLLRLIKLFSNMS